MANPNGVAAKAPHGMNGTATSFNDWPNDAGFDTFYEETTPVQLKVSGKIPAYAAGVLYRTGPGGYQVTTRKNTTFSASHWFDGFSQTHRFEILPPSEGKFVSSVVYNSRHTCNDHVENLRKNGAQSGITFGQQQDPCESFFKKVMSTFQAMAMPARTSRGPEGVNVGVTIKANLPMPKQEPKDSSSKNDANNGIESLWQRTDNATLQKVDPQTMQPIETTNQQQLHPELRGPFTGAHARTDPVTGDWYNYNLEVGRQATYRVFSVSATTGKVRILASLSGGTIRPAYLHSILLTKNYVIVCIFDAYYAKNGLKVLWTKNMLDAMEFDPNKKNQWLVIDRVGDKGLVGMFESDPFFAFHPVNMWEESSKSETGKVDIIADIPCYDNLDVLKRFYYDNMKGTSTGSLAYTGEKGQSCRPALKRWKLPNVGSTTISTTDNCIHAKCIFMGAKGDSPELPTFNPDYATKPSRYIYGVCDKGNSTFLDGLVKYDTETQSAALRIKHAQSPGEPIFLPNPDGVDEDDGILLSVVLDGTQGKSYLLVLDAKSFEEVGRADMETVVTFGFHGTHVPSAGVQAAKPSQS